jgi:hypothetical protein
VERGGEVGGPRLAILISVSPTRRRAVTSGHAVVTLRTWEWPETKKGRGKMTIDFRVLNINFDPTSGRAQRESATAVFNSNIRRANAALRGFNISFNNGDHNFLREEIDIDITAVQNNTVEVAVDFVLRDNSGTFDDPYSGKVEVLVIADVV